MKRLLRFSLMTFLAAFNSAAAIDMTPVPSEYKAEGITFKQLVFKDGQQRITYELPVQWSYHAFGDSVKLLPPGNSPAEAIIQAIPLANAQPLDQKGISLAREHFLHGIPPGTQLVKVVSEEQNTIPLKAGPSYEITVSYQALGETFTRRAIYINLADTQLIFRLTARTKEFANLDRAFRGSILTWQWTAADPRIVASK
jgi:hypothetical protein